jgi:nucleoside diphosphate kinase
VAKPIFSDFARQMQSDVVTGLELVGENAIQSLQELVGPSSPSQAQREDPHTVRARFGQDDLRNAVHVS